MTETRKTIATIAAAVLSAAAALTMGQAIGETIARHGATDTTTSTATTYAPPTTEELDVISEGCDSGQVTDAGVCVPDPAGESTDDAPACRTVDWGYGSDEAAWDALLAAGWIGNPTDGVERLYSPECPRG